MNLQHFSILTSLPVFQLFSSFIILACVHSSEETKSSSSIPADIDEGYTDLRPGHHERRLLKFLLDDHPYRSLARPYDIYNEPVNVTIGMTLQQIISVDEKNQILTSNIWLNLAWTDDSLRWDPAEYGGLETIKVPPKKIWKPDLILYSTADERFDASYHTNIVVYSSGYVSWIPPGIVRSNCEIDVEFFPFDEQKCPLKYGMWSYDGLNVDLQTTPNLNELNDTSEMSENGEWQLLSLDVERHAVTYECCGDTPFIDVTYTLHIRRRSMYYVVNILIPCMMLSVLSLLSFVLPSETGEKLSFCVTLLLSMNFFMLIVADSVPSTSLVLPVVSKYFTCVLVMVSVSVFMTIVTINLSGRNANTHVMGTWMRKIFLEWLPILLYMKQPGHEYEPLCGNKDKIAGHPSRNIELMEHAPSYRDRRGNGVTPQGAYLNDVNMIGIKYANYAAEENEPMIVDTRGAPRERRNRELCLILEELRIMNGRHEKQDKDDQCIHDWKFASMVLDRLALIVIGGCTVISSYAILSMAPWHKSTSDVAIS